MNLPLAEAMHAAIWRLRPCLWLDGEATSSLRRGTGPANVVLARGQLTFIAFNAGPLARLRGRNLRSALSLRARSEQPVADVGAFAAIRGETVMLWMWDRQRVEVPLHKAGREPASVTVVPEPLLHPARDEGLHLVQCRRGWTLEHWRRGALLASRWSLQRPTSEQCDAFARSCGLDTSVPFATHEAPADLAASTPWAVNLLAEGALFKRRTAEAAAWASGLVALCGVLGWFTASQVTLERARDGTRAELAALKSSAANALAAEARALQARASAEAISNGLGTRPWLPLLEVVGPTLARAGLVVEEFAANGNDVRIAVSHPRKAPSPIAVVDALEASGWLTQVRVVPGADARSVIVTARVVQGPARGT